MAIRPSSREPKRPDPRTSFLDPRQIPGWTGPFLSDMTHHLRGRPVPSSSYVRVATMTSAMCIVGRDSLLPSGSQSLASQESSFSIVAYRKVITGLPNSKTSRCAHAASSVRHAPGAATQRKSESLDFQREATSRAMRRAKRLRRLPPSFRSSSTRPSIPKRPARAGTSILGILTKATRLLRSQSTPMSVQMLRPPSWRASRRTTAARPRRIPTPTPRR
mmetsp:Transcript_2005/g.4649  ORF Transcript_2005/g.4649 Transcript_2005/m.4649 type:complete len:219 (-) Transcript_2005:217-873(-)